MQSFSGTLAPWQVAFKQRDPQASFGAFDRSGGTSRPATYDDHISNDRRLNL
jgi:hypothetical protein